MIRILRRHETLLFLEIVLLFCLVGCAVMQQATPPAPQTPRQALLLAAHELTAVMATANDALEQKLIGFATHQKVLVGVENGRRSLALSKEALSVGDLTTAQGQLQAANTVLLAMRALLTGGAQ